MPGATDRTRRAAEEMARISGPHRAGFFANSATEVLCARRAKL